MIEGKARRDAGPAPTRWKQRKTSEGRVTAPIDEEAEQIRQARIVARWVKDAEGKKAIKLFDVGPDHYAALTAVQGLKELLMAGRAWEGS